MNSKHKIKSAAFRSISLLMIALIAGCAGVQINSTPVDRFGVAKFETFSWRAAPIGQRQGSKDPLAVVDPTLRSAVNKALVGKGYREIPEGGDFVIDYQFKASLSEGALSSSAYKASNEFPAPNPNVVVNRRTNQALVDNAYALAGPREVNSILLEFSDGDSQGLVWAGSISKVVEDLNRDDSEGVRKSINRAVVRLLRTIPNAER